MNKLAENTRLEELDLECAGYDNELASCMPALSRMRLTFLSLSKARMDADTTAAFAAHLATMSNLRELNIAEALDDGVSNTLAASIAALGDLTCLMMVDCPGLRVPFLLQCVRGLSSLATLSV